MNIAVLRKPPVKRLLLFLAGALTALALSQSGRGLMFLQRLIRVSPLSTETSYSPFTYSTHYGYLLDGLDAICSGSVEGSYFITAKHCTDAIGVVNEGNKAKVLVSDDFTNSKVYETVLVKSYKDIAILRFIEFKDGDDRSRSGGAETSLRRGEEVYIVLGGFGLYNHLQTPFYIVRTYKVIGIVDAKSIGIDWYKGEALLLEGGSFAGCSGSPVYDKNGNLIGVLSGGVADFTIVCPL